MDNLARSGPSDAFGHMISRLVTTDGSMPIIAPLQKFLDDSSLTRDLRSPAKLLRAALIADIAHFMCLSHGRLPGVIDHAANKIVDDCARSWLVQSIEAFALERMMMNQLAVAAGPIKRLFGQNKITAILQNQAKSFELLATSDRKGCSAGTAIAFMLDWQASRGILDQIAIALGIEPRLAILPTAPQSEALCALLADSDAKKRAMLFGAQQILAQQRGLWQLIAARHLEMGHQQ